MLAGRALENRFAFRQTSCGPDIGALFASRRTEAEARPQSSNQLEDL